SRRSTCFRRRQPVRVSQNPPCGGDSCVVLMSVTPTSSDIYRCLLTDADLEVLPTDPQPAGADLKGKRIHVAGRGAAGFLGGGVEQPGVAGADEPRLIRVPVDGTAQVRADRGKDTDLAVPLPLPADPDGVARPRLSPAVLADDFQRKQPPLT